MPGRRHDRLTRQLARTRLKAGRRKRTLADGSAGDRSGHHRCRSAASHVRDRARDARGCGGRARVCRTELWNVSQMTGWQVQFGYLVTIQPVGTDEARSEALARWASLPRIHRHRDRQSARRAEARLLRAQGHRPHRHRSDEHADQPARPPTRRSCRRRSATRRPNFSKAFDDAGEGADHARVHRYRDFLSKEYLPAAREEIAVTANPMGARLLRRVRPRVQHAAGPRQGDSRSSASQQMDALMAEMKADRRAVVRNVDVPGLLKTLRTDRRYMFKDRAGADRLLEGRARASEGGGAGVVRASAEGRREHRAVSEVPREERARTSTTRRPKTAAGRPFSSSAPTRLKKKSTRARSRRRSTRRFPAITCR